MADVLTRIPWDSLPPLEALVIADGGAGVPVLTARQGRRGVERPVILARDEGGGRTLETLGTGVYRWGLRGGVGAEALRTLVAVGVDWLLRSDRMGGLQDVTTAPAVTRGNPITFRWHGDETRDSLRIELSSESGVVDTVVRFGPQGVASLPMPVGVYRWAAREIGGSGTAVVEPYSDEYRPNPVWTPASSPTVSHDTGLREYVRDRWWIFLLGIAALAGEWAWRQRRGLP
jgi:hypothetical protein